MKDSQDEAEKKEEEAKKDEEEDEDEEEEETEGKAEPAEVSYLIHLTLILVFEKLFPLIQGRMTYQPIFRLLFFLRNTSSILTPLISVYQLEINCHRPHEFHLFSTYLDYLITYFSKYFLLLNLGTVFYHLLFIRPSISISKL